MAEELSFVDLFRSPEEIAESHAERLAKTERLQQAIGSTVGSAASEDERIKVAFTEAEGIQKLELDPRTLRMPSEELADEIARVVNEARDDARRQVQTLTEEATDSGLPDPAALVEQMPQIERSIDDLMRDSQTMTRQVMDIVERMQRMSESQGTPRRTEPGR